MADTFSAYWARKAVREALARDVNKATQGQTPRHHGFARRPQRGGFMDLDPSPGNEVRRFTPENLPEDPRRPQASQRSHVASFAMESSESEENVKPSSLLPVIPPKWPEKSKVCIIGAGVTGLYIAMILDSLALPGLTYEILEGDHRIGGRMLTHYFSNTAHDYYDIGAMRFPHLSIMKRTFDLFKRLNIPLVKYYLDPRKVDPPKPEIEGSVMTPTMYNDICVVDDGTKSKDPDPFCVSLAKGGLVPDGRVDATKLLNDAFGPFKERMAKDFEDGFNALMEYDHMSTRQYLRDEMGYDVYTIQWLETNGTSTNLFDQAFTESVIDSFDFDPPKGLDASDWFCINGGTSLVTEGMKNSLDQARGTVETSKRVTKITQLADENLMVEVSGEAEPRGPYTTVFNTTSLGCLGRMDLTGLDLHPTQKDAIRSLHYDDSAKVAIKFSYPWWIKECGITTGGAGNTDLPLRTCVYPSYNLKDGDSHPAILLCSYTWAQDALRVGSLIEQKPTGEGDGVPPEKPLPPTQGEEQLKDLMFDNLARLHLKNFNTAKAQGKSWTLAEVRTLIKNAYVTHHAYSWSHDPYTSGAFALFGPSQFYDIYPYLVRPTAKGRFHILGEASSAHHAWIVGSLESAYSGVYKFLDKYGLFEDQDRMVNEWDEIPEFKDERGGKGSIWLQVALGDPASLLFPAAKAG